jgi:hypothetical protein
MNTSIKKIAAVTGFILGAFVLSALAYEKAGSTPTNSNTAGPITVGVASLPNVLQTKNDSLNILGVLGAKSFSFIPGGTIAKGSFLKSSSLDANGNAVWKKPIYCSTEAFFGGQAINSAHYVYFTASDCGGTLPDSTYRGAITQAQICHGFQNVRVFTVGGGESAYSTFAGVYFWGDAPNDVDSYQTGCTGLVPHPKGWADVNGNIIMGKIGAFSALYIPFN